MFLSRKSIILYTSQRQETMSSSLLDYRALIYLACNENKLLEPSSLKRLPPRWRSESLNWEPVDCSRDRERVGKYLSTALSRSYARCSAGGLDLVVVMNAVIRDLQLAKLHQLKVARRVDTNFYVSRSRTLDPDSLQTRPASLVWAASWHSDRANAGNTPYRENEV